MKQLEPLKKGDTVALAATARKVSPEEMAPAIGMLRSWGLNVLVPEGLYAEENQFAGIDTHRAALLQGLLDDPKVSAIFCCRGGYGTVRIIDRLDFSRFAEHPKWIVGYSDVTVLHCHLHNLGFPSLHATMPINFASQPTPATESLRRTLFGEATDIEWESPYLPPLNAPLYAPVVGGNLSILYSLLGSSSQIDTRGKILLIEDLDEYLYHIDRMMQALRRAGMLDDLTALVVGGMTDMHDNSIPFGRTAEQIVSDTVAGLPYPVFFNAPFGHLGDNNLAIHLGTKIRLTTTDSKKIRIFAV